MITVVAMVLYPTKWPLAMSSGLVCFPVCTYSQKKKNSLLVIFRLIFDCLKPNHEMKKMQIFANWFPERIPSRKFVQSPALDTSLCMILAVMLCCVLRSL